MGWCPDAASRRSSSQLSCDGVGIGLVFASQLQSQYDHAPNTTASCELYSCSGTMLVKVQKRSWLLRTKTARATIHFLTSSTITDNRSFSVFGDPSILSRYNKPWSSPGRSYWRNSSRMSLPPPSAAVMDGQFRLTSGAFTVSRTKLSGLARVANRLFVKDGATILTVCSAKQMRLFDSNKFAAVEWSATTDRYCLHGARRTDVSTACVDWGISPSSSNSPVNAPSLRFAI